jgi:cobalt/nickel transport system ATP-binding protein
MPVEKEIIKVSCVKHIYSDRTEVFLCGLDFVVHEGERVVILGPNGSGKSTLLHHILGLLEPHEGAVRVFGHNPAKEYEKIRNRVGVLLQDVDDQIIAPTVADDIAFSPRNLGYPEREVEALVERAMEQVKIAHLRNKICHYLSEGEKRKVALAGALVLKPELLILDEPLEGLDPKSRVELIALLNQLHAQGGFTIVMTTHDVNLVSHFADSVYMLVKGGEIVSRGSPRDIFANAELLFTSNLDPPLLAALFKSLKDHGLDVRIPLTIEEAVNEIIRLERKQGREAHEGA